MMTMWHKKIKLNINYKNDDYFKHLEKIRTIDNKHSENEE